ncbi:cell division protein FtsK [Thiohalocapsa marina]|uniref:DNA translocase FtsK n=1 Tax=Thiohalocapsa marina TaxID=424902 RepID=A0A5M8FPM6_9GAMM|nr:DNA translocase FtsK [Thiohalocapsa marina]KAA6184385.1 cell division protein FtsK [Thiohalocapsa marina]
MTQATRVGQLSLTDYLDRAWREGAMWILICAALYLVLALASYSPQDSGWSFVGTSEDVVNAGGRFGAWFADLALFLFGLFAYLIPAMVAWSAYLVFRQREPEPETKLLWLALRWMGFAMTLAAGSALASIHLVAFASDLPNGIGGGLGQLLADYAVRLFGATGSSLALAALLLAGFTLLTGLSLLFLVDAVGAATLAMVRLGSRIGRDSLRLRAPDLGLSRLRLPQLRLPKLSLSGMSLSRLFTRQDDDMDDDLELFDAAELQPHLRRSARRPRPPTSVAKPQDDPLTETVAATWPAPEPDPQPAPEGDRQPAARPGPGMRNPFRRKAAAEAPPARCRRDASGFQRPPLDLLDAPRKSARAETPEQMETMSRELEARLAEFGVVAEVVAVHPGPVVALFELELAPGLKVSKITGLAKDIARALSKVSVRVVEVIPGKSVIGLEVPNDQREMVVLQQILGSSAYLEAKSPLTIGMGTNISGAPVVADLGRMPHALIAGTTGSGKSVAINAMILSLIYKAPPEDVRLIMVDPKMLELSVYEGIPHLLTPVVTDMKEAANALRWCVGEMERRYKLMASLGVRNIAGYNRKVQDAIDAGTPIPDPTYRFADNPPFAMDDDGDAALPEIPTLSRLPYIVVIIDELADMMMVVGKKVEELIARLAQKARASGIHLLLATQRPSVDVLTGLIKANIPTRMAFKVSARVDSRTVLDQMGAEHLLGHGDMLYLPPGGSIPQRVHGAFVDDQEVHRVVDFLKQQGQPDYIDTILQEPSEHLPGIDPEPRGGGDVEDQDPLFDEAVHYVVESRRASISGVQRKLKIGYNRAARMIEEMERIGIVGAAETNGNREVLAPPPPAD